MPNRIPLEEIKSSKYGRLTVLREVGQGKNKSRRFECLCECGKKTIVRLTHLRGGRTISCGCAQRDGAVRSNKNRTKHGLCNHPLYVVWNNMVQRCINSNSTSYRYYGERGIKVCDGWKNDSSNFIAWALKNGWEKGLQIDRIDNNGNYKPSNCRFVTPKENTRNSRSTGLTMNDIISIRSIHENGNLYQREIGEMFGVSQSAISSIVKYKKWK